MKKKKFITPKVRVIKLEAQELLAGSQKNAPFGAAGIENGGSSWYDSGTNGTNGTNGEDGESNS